MTGSKYDKAMRRSADRVRDRLRELAKYQPGRRYYWADGVIRERWCHPTKGWRDNRVEAFEVVVDGWRVTRGFVDLQGPTP